MKVYFASNTDLQLRPVDAWVDTAEEGHTILNALAFKYYDHNIIMRARVKQGSNDEDRYIGLAKATAALDFLDRVKRMA